MYLIVYFMIVLGISFPSSVRPRRRGADRTSAHHFGIACVGGTHVVIPPRAASPPPRRPPPPPRRHDHPLKPRRYRGGTHDDDNDEPQQRTMMMTASQWNSCGRRTYYNTGRGPPLRATTMSAAARSVPNHPPPHIPPSQCADAVKDACPSSGSPRC